MSHIIPSSENNSHTILEIDIADILSNPHQPRLNFSDEELQSLANSIKEVGLLHPPLVKWVPSLSCYQIISGERRVKAMKLAGMKKITVCIQNFGTYNSAVAALVENIQRVDLNPLEVARSMQQLIDEFKITQEAVALRLSMKRSTVTNYLRLLHLPPEIQLSLMELKISMGHAKAILSLKNSAAQSLLHELILTEKLSVRETEKRALKIEEKQQKNRLKSVNRDFYLEMFERKLQDKLETKASIIGSYKKGKISLNYYSLQDLEKILTLLGVELD